jgi:hypothetical protein
MMALPHILGAAPTMLSATRDRLVLQCCYEAGLPVAITMAGGYAPKIEDSVDIHFQTVRIAAEFQKMN